MRAFFGGETKLLFFINRRDVTGRKFFPVYVEIAFNFLITHAILFLDYSSLALARRTYSVQQCFFTERLGQENDGARPHCFPADFLMVVGGDKNYGNAAALSNQLALQFQAAYAWHGNIEEETSGFFHNWGTQELFRRSESFRPESVGSQEAGCCLSDRSVIVHYRYQIACFIFHVRKLTLLSRCLPLYLGENRLT